MKCAVRFPADRIRMTDRADFQNRRRNMFNPGDAFRVQNYYQRFSHCSMPAAFVFLQPAEVSALAEGETEGAVVEGVIRRISEAMNHFFGKRFISVDFCAPTDCPRYLSSKHGSVASAESGWYSLVTSPKIREMAANGLVQCICVRAFRTFDVPREFRLFIKDGKLAAMSQRFLIRHFRRLEKRTGEYWEIANNFFDSIQPMLPVPDLAMDIYVTSRKKVIMLDLNPWGDPTDPLMMASWNRDLSTPLGCLIVPPPHMISGDVNVSF